MAEVVIYTKHGCPYCTRAKQLLDSKRVSYQEIGLDSEPNRRQEMIEKSGRHTVPQIFINGKSVGGCDDLHELERQGKLDSLLK